MVNVNEVIAKLRLLLEEYGTPEQDIQLLLNDFRKWADDRSGWYNSGFSIGYDFQ